MKYLLTLFIVFFCLDSFCQSNINKLPTWTGSTAGGYVVFYINNTTYKIPVSSLVPASGPTTFIYGLTPKADSTYLQINGVRQAIAQPVTKLTLVYPLMGDSTNTISFSKAALDSLLTK